MICRYKSFVDSHFRLLYRQNLFMYVVIYFFLYFLVLSNFPFFLLLSGDEAGIV